MRPSTTAFVSAVLFALALAACSQPAAAPPDAGPDLAPPPVVCRMAGAPATPWFTEVTADVGLAPSKDTTPLATTLHAADLDGDGYGDFIATTPADERDAPGKRHHWLFMNRPAPDDPSGKRRVFVDATAASNILVARDGMPSGFGVLSLGDIDNDGDVDVVTCPGGADVDPGAALLNDGAGHFTLGPASELETLLAGIGPATSVLVDFDRDGLLDFVPGTFQYPPPNNNPPLLLKGLGGGAFKDVAEQLGINVVFGDYAADLALPSMYGITACDLDGDGNQDLLFADYGRAFNLVYLNDGKKFTEMGRMLGIASDDRTDYSDDQSYRCYCQNHPNACKPMPPAPIGNICTAFGGNEGRGWNPGFDDQPYRLGGNNFTIVCGDIDDDGDNDLYITDIRHGDTGSASDPTELVINPNTAPTPPGMKLAKFIRPGNVKTGLDRPEGGINWNEGDLGAAFADVDLDGRKDIYLQTSDYPDKVSHGWIWHQKADGTFEDASKDSGMIASKQPHGFAFFDFDHDGDLDLVSGTSTARGGAPTSAIHFYRNDIGQNANFMQVQLEGKGAGHANRSGIGARVKVTAGGRTQVQELNGGFGSSSIQNDLVLTFGLGASCLVDSVEVRWPDGAGTVQTFKDVRANYRVKIKEGEERVSYVF